MNVYFVSSCIFPLRSKHSLKYHFLKLRVVYLSLHAKELTTLAFKQSSILLESYRLYGLICARKRDKISPMVFLKVQRFCLDYVLRFRRQQNKQYNFSLSRERFPLLSCLNRADTLFFPGLRAVCWHISLRLGFLTYFSSFDVCFKTGFTWNCAVAYLNCVYVNSNSSKLHSRISYVWKQI